MFYFRNLY